MRLPWKIDRRPSGPVLVGASAWLTALASLAFSQSFGVYVAVWERSMGWSAAALAGAFALNRGLMIGSNPLVGNLVSRFGPRRVAGAGVVLLAAGLAMLGTATSLRAVYLLMPLFTLALTAMGTLTLSTAIVARFVRWRSVAMGLVLTGVGIGGLFVPLLASSVVARGMGTTLFGLAVIVLLTGLPASRLLGAGAKAARTPAASPPPTMAILRDVVRRAEFWWLGIAHTLSGGTNAALAVLLVPFVGRAVGLSLETAGLMVSVLAVASVVAQVGNAPLADRFGHRLAASLGATLEAGGLLGLATAVSPAAAALWTALIGLGWGTRNPQMYVLRADYFGLPTFPVVMGLSLTLTTLGAVAIPIAAASVFGGPVGFLSGPRSAIVLMACFAGSGAAAFALMPRPRPRSP